MWSQRAVAGWVIGVAVAGAALAQTNGTLRWRGGNAPLGLQPAVGQPHVQCGAFSLACDSTSVVPLYASPVAPRSLSMEVGSGGRTSALGLARTQGSSLSLVGKAGLFQDVGVYGRVGTTIVRAGYAAGQGFDPGLTYGVGLSWDFSRRASAVLGFDSYDVRGAAGELRDVRATSLGLQWRY